MPLFPPGTAPLTIIFSTVSDGFTYPTTTAEVLAAIPALNDVITKLSDAVTAVSNAATPNSHVQHYVSVFSDAAAAVSADIVGGAAASTIITKLPIDVPAMFHAALQVGTASFAELFKSISGYGCPGNSTAITGFQKWYAKSFEPLPTTGIYDQPTALALAAVLGSSPPACGVGSGSGAGSGSGLPVGGSVNPGPVATEPAAISTTADVLVIISSIGTIGYLAWKLFQGRKTQSR